MTRVAGIVVAAVAVVAGTAGSLVSTSAPAVATAPAAECSEDASVSAASLDAAFASGVDGIVGADYQRAIELDDGRVLWLFQDAFVEMGDGSTRLVHNVGALQTGDCFEALVGDGTTSWIGGDLTRSTEDWYWPLDGYQRDDGTVVVHVAEMTEPGGSYLNNATPVATWQTTVDLDTLTTSPLTPAPDPSPALYGFEIEHDETYRYFYGQCHRQFGFSEIGHDECASTVTVARRPLDDDRAPLEYWNGTEWTRNSRVAANVAPLVTPGDEEFRFANPMQVDYIDGRWIAVTKVNDWYGDTMHFDVADAPQGPWTTTSVMPVSPPTDDGTTNTYFASFVPTDEGQTIAVSSNRWDGELSSSYRPRFETVSMAVWAPREAVRVTDDLWLPLGEPIVA